MLRAVLIALMTLVAAGDTPLAFAEQNPTVNERRMRRVLRMAFPSAPADWRPRLIPDETMATCTQWNNQPPKDVAAELKQRELARLKLPPDGQFIGDWRRGEKIAQSGYGLRFTDADTKRANGGNCYACHELSPDEVSFGTLGVSLKGFGRTHKFEANYARVVYEKIYNSQAIVACSMMPRFGANGILTIEQIKDVVAYLMDPESPVNQEAGARSQVSGTQGDAPRQPAERPGK